MTAEERAELERLKGRLDYAVLQLAREGKFLPADRPENRRFHRAFTCITEVRDDLEEVLR